ncbi:MAG: DNA oxidative demethylase AlkB [Gammaproteobacteria bacterium]|nr:DNA oxidative demethylase AlkB [Gammaproteobacteria bacterium]
MQTEIDFSTDGESARVLDDGAMLLRGYAVDDADLLLAAIARISAAAPFRHMQTPGGQTMSVAMTNCGPYGWVTDRRGYRYQSEDPLSGQPWPSMPDEMLNLAVDAAAAAGYPSFKPDACLINRYEPGAKMGLHQDRDEANLGQPVVSVSLGLPAVFLWGGPTRTSPRRRIALHHGDVVVWGGPSRLYFHGVDILAAGQAGGMSNQRFNLTFRVSH